MWFSWISVDSSGARLNARHIFALFCILLSVLSLISDIHFSIVWCKIWFCVLGLQNFDLLKSKIEITSALFFTKFSVSIWLFSMRNKSDEYSICRLHCNRVVFFYIFNFVNIARLCIGCLVLGNWNILCDVSCTCSLPPAASPTWPPMGGIMHLLKEWKLRESWLWVPITIGSYL
jgi:hypothetical protein